MTERLEIVSENVVAERYVGTMNVVVTDKLGAGFGQISAPEMTQVEAEAEMNEATTFLTRIDWHNPAVCIDGRHLADGEKKLPLGPHIAGGAETLLVAAKSVGYHLEGKELIERAKELGFTLGGHDADSNKEDGYKGGTGCGACDKCGMSCGLMNENKQAAEATVSTLMGSDFNKEVYDRVALVPVEGGLQGVVDDSLIETLHDDHEGVHGHRERLVVFNYIDETSIDRDEYFEQTGKQVFVVDMWYLKRLADAMATGVDAEKQASELYHAMVDFQVATYLGLCDGSHRAGLIV